MEKLPELLKTCDQCKGEGYVGLLDPCPNCNGSKKVLTEAGKRVAEVIVWLLQQMGK